MCAMGARGPSPQASKPIVDNIYMHGGTGLIYYFYRKAQREDPNDPELFHTQPKPNTREAGIVHLADKVEAAAEASRSRHWIESGR